MILVHHQFNFGGSYTKHHFSPSFIDLTTDWGEYSDTTMTFSNQKTPDEFFIYFEDEYSITDRLSSNLGLHYSIYHENSDYIILSATNKLKIFIK